MNQFFARCLLAILIISSVFDHEVSYGQTASSPWQAQYATGGTGTHTGDICWLTWGSSGNTISNGTYYWNLTPTIQAIATITGIASDGNNTNPLTAYNSGGYSMDGLQILYSGVNPIGLRDRVSGDGVSFNISVQLLINNVPVSYPGMVIADAESMATNEYISAETAGTGWQLLDLRNAAPPSTQSDYQLVISNLQKKFTINTVNSSNQGIQAVLFAQGVTSLTNVKLQGGGITALALGLIVPFDFGDAPASYGAAGNYINGFTSTGSVVTNGTFSMVNIVKSNLIPTANVYMGAANIDADANPPFSAMADYDDNKNADDENGVTFTGGSLMVNQTGNYPVSVVATNSSAKNATIYGWIDFNNDGIFSPNELATATVPAGTTSPITITLTYNLDNYKHEYGTFNSGTSYARFRITTDNLTNAGTTLDQRSQTAALDGETEDYPIIIADNPGLITLPLAVRNFNAAKIAAGVNLSWNTDDAQDINDFEVQYSADGQNWETIGHVASAQRGNGMYNWTDVVNHNNSNSFYRLKIIGLDGHFSYSAVKLISSEISAAIQCYPNPTHNMINLVSAAGVTCLEVFSMSGSKLTSVKGTNLHEISLENFPRGCYMIRILKDSQIITCTAVVKQ